MFQRSRGVLVRPGQPGCKSRLNRAVFLLHSSDNPEKDRQVPAGVESMVEPAQAANIRSWIEIGDRFCRSWPEISKRALDCAEHAFHISIGERGGYETDGFPIVIANERGLVDDQSNDAFKNVNLKVRRHSIHALIGPNGAGKTTCFNLLTHFLAPTAGRFLLVLRVDVD